jgi:hypothetical protein
MNRTEAEARKMADEEALDKLASVILDYNFGKFATTLLKDSALRTAFRAQARANAELTLENTVLPLALYSHLQGYSDKAVARSVEDIFPLLGRTSEYAALNWWRQQRRAPEFERHLNRLHKLIEEYSIESHSDMGLYINCLNQQEREAMAKLS